MGLVEDPLASGLRELEDPFIENWGTIADAFGMSRGTGRVHGLIYLARQPLDATQIGMRLRLSESQVNSHLRQLSAWRVIESQTDLQGHTTYQTVREPWTWFLRTLQERRHREFVPILISVRNVSAFATELRSQAGEGASAELRLLHERITHFGNFFDELAQLLDTLTRLGRNPLMAAVKWAARLAR